MKALFRLFIPLLFGIVMASACGGSSSSSGGSAGSVATAGASGMQPEGGGTGFPTAGAPGNMAGAGGANAACPSAAPMAGGMCTLGGGTACHGARWALRGCGIAF